MDCSSSSWMRVNFGCGMHPESEKGCREDAGSKGEYFWQPPICHWDKTTVLCSWTGLMSLSGDLSSSLSSFPLFMWQVSFSGPLRLPLQNEQCSNQCTLNLKILESCLKSLQSKTISSYMNQILQRSGTSRSLPAYLSIYPSVYLLREFRKLPHVIEWVWNP